jgi:hypothetical protein
MNRSKKIEFLKSVAAGAIDVNTVELTAKQLRGEVFVIHNFLDHLKFSNTIGRKDEDFAKAIIAPGDYRDFLMTLY